MVYISKHIARSTCKKQTNIIRTRLVTSIVLQTLPRITLVSLLSRYCLAHTMFSFFTHWKSPSSTTQRPPHKEDDTDLEAAATVPLVPQECILTGIVPEAYTTMQHHPQQVPLYTHQPLERTQHALVQPISPITTIVSQPPRPVIATSPIVPTLSPSPSPTLPLRIAIAGKIASGKTTLASHICNLYMMQHSREPTTIRRIGFGDAVKDTEWRLFGEGGSSTSTTSATSATSATSTTHHHTPIHKNRTRLVQIGTKMRDIDPDVWVNVVIRTIEASPHLSWVIDDLRFHNEYEALRRAGFFIVRLDVAEHLRHSRIRQHYPPDTAEAHLAANQHASEQEVAEQLGVEAFDTVVTYATEEERVGAFEGLYRVLEERWGIGGAKMV